MQFVSSTWINNSQNIILTGPTGCGKTYIAEAIGLQACKMGFPAVKKRYRMLFEEIHEAKGTGQYLKYLKKIEKIKVLIIDDFVMNDINNDDLNDLMDIIELREQVSSIIITTQYPTSKWHLKLPDPTIADAICDRIVHGAFEFNLKGGSMRKLQNK
jgi:DNA replication protein DnaC